MKTYLVGGAVRDKLLGLPVLDRDWVVVGETPQSMIAAGYQSVGKDFPVFLHPESHEEYALARTERKTAPGYHGFEFDTAKTVTLEEDLSRRDLTINAIAEDKTGILIDPFNGQQDIQNRTLRHVAPAFAEDPVRVLRIAKFMARFAHLGFNVASTTIKLIQSMVANGEVDSLVAERVWKEFESALLAPTPQAFFTTLMRTGALAKVMPELDQLATDDENATSDEQAPLFLQFLQNACAMSTEGRIRFAAMCAAFEAKGVTELQALCSRLRVPNSHAELALLCARYADQAVSSLTLDAEQLHSLLKALDVSRRPERFNEFLTAVKALNIDNEDFEAGQHLQVCANAMANVEAGQLAQAETDKSRIPRLIKEHEIAAIENTLQSR